MDSCFNSKDGGREQHTNLDLIFNSFKKPFPQSRPCWEAPQLERQSVDFSCTNNSENVKPCTLSQATSRQGFFGSAEAQLSTHYSGRQQAPVVITYGAPLSVFQHLHSALAYDGPTTETDQRLLRRKMFNHIFRLFCFFQKWQSQLKLFLLRDEKAEAADWVASCLKSVLLVRFSH